jgi:hypothetical protein
MAGTFSSPPGSEGASPDDPVSWLQIEPGWSVVGSDGAAAGSVVSVAGDKHEDIFDGLAISTAGPGGARYVPGERVGRIFPGKVALRFPSTEVDQLEEFQAPAPTTVWRVPDPSLAARLSSWIRGKR